jgi:ParB family chromosome partitioning protein
MANPAASSAPPEQDAPAGYELHRLPIDRIDVPRARIRREMGALGELAYSLGSVGILQPIQVLKAGARYRLIAGERRLAAARMLGWAEIEALVREPRGNDLLLELVENAQRKFLTDAEEADAFIRLRDEGYVLTEVAAQAGRSEAYVSKRIRVFEDLTLRTAVERDHLAVSMAEEFLTVAPDERGPLVARAIGERWDMARVRSAIRGPQVEPELPSDTEGRTSELPAQPEHSEKSANVVEGSYREVDGSVEPEQGLLPVNQSRDSDSNQLRGRELVRQLNAARQAIRELRAYDLSPAEERALAALLQALLFLARARQRGAKGPVFPSLEVAEKVSRSP